MYEKRFHLISDLLDKEFINVDDIKNKINKLPFTSYERFYNAILRSWPDVRYIYTIADQALQPYQSTVIRHLTRGKRFHIYS